MNKNPFPIPRNVIIGVVSFHVMVCAFFFFSKPTQKARSINAPIQAKHYTLEKELPKKASSPAKTNQKVAKTLAPKKTIQKKETPQTQKHLAKKQEPVKSTPQKEPASSPLKSETSKPTPTQSSETPQVASTQKAAAGSRTFSNDFSYADQLGLLLKSKVSLKNSGFVRIKLKLSSKGEVMNLDVVGASDSDFIVPVQEQIKALDFPSFDATMKNKKSEVFTFEFSAD